MWNNKRKSKAYSGLQQDYFGTTPSSNQFQWGTKSGDTSPRYSYHSIGSTGSMPCPPSSSTTSTSRSHKIGPSRFSIRNSSLSRSTAWCLGPFRWCVACYESKFITIEPVLFIVMFAVYLHKILSELYLFNNFSRRSIDNSSSNYSNGMNTTCISTDLLNNVTYMKGQYDVNGLLWSNKTGDAVEKDTGLLIMMLNLAMGAMSIFGTLLLGPLSNRFGRKPILLSILTGMLLQALMTVLVIELNLDVHYLIIGAGLRGVTGGVAGVYTVSYSYITEFSQDKKKWLIVRIGIVETLSFIAVSLGLVLGGVGIQEVKCDFSIPAFVVLGCLTCVLLYVAITTPGAQGHVAATTMPQSPLPVRREGCKVHQSPRALLRGARLFASKTQPRTKLWLSLLVMAIAVVNSSGMTAVITLFLLHQPFVWSPIYIGGYLGMSEFIHGLVLVVVLPMLLSIGVHDGTIVVLSIAMTVTMNVTLGFADASWHVFLVGILQSAEVLIVATLKAMLSKSVQPHEKGGLFTFISVVQILSTMLGSALYVPIYILSLNRGWPPQHSSAVTFLLMALLHCVAFPLMCVLSITNHFAKKRGSLLPHTSNNPSINSGLLSSHEHTGPQGRHVIDVSGKYAFDVSIGQDLVDKEGSIQSRLSVREERNNDFLEHSYSSLSDYHSNRQ